MSKMKDSRNSHMASSAMRITVGQRTAKLPEHLCAPEGRCREKCPQKGRTERSSREGQCKGGKKPEVQCRAQCHMGVEQKAPKGSEKAQCPTKTFQITVP